MNVECFGYVQKAHADSYTEHDIQTLLVCDKITSLANCVKIVKVEETEDSPFIEVTGEIKVGVEDEEIDS